MPRRSVRTLVPLALVAIAACAVVLVVALGSPSPARAVIIDQLSLTHPNPDFVAAATAMLESAGYEVDYFPGERVRVNLLKELPSRGYGFVLLRTHSARIEGPDGLTDDVALFTGEMIDLDRYSISGVPPEAATAVAQAIAGAQSAGSPVTPEPTHSVSEAAGLVPVFYDPHSGELPFFGLRPSYIEQELDGRFGDDTTVVLMGCDGLRSTALADAFLLRGARTFVSWTEPVSADHTDRATESLMRAMLEERLDAHDAVERTNQAVGPDPHYGARLVERER